MELVMLTLSEAKGKHLAGETLRSAQGDVAPFADRDSVKQGWYLIARNRISKIRAVNVGPHRVLVYRDLDGRVHVTEAQCAHLGADLARAFVTSNGLRCAFHGWCWGADGACTASPGNRSIPNRRLRTYVTEERIGFIWAWLGGLPEFPLPEPPPWHQWTLLPQSVRAHPDTTFANGFDLAHFGPSHGIEVKTKSLHVDSWAISHRIEGRLPLRPPLVAVGLGGATLDATFTQYGGGIVHVHVQHPIEYLIVFTIRPDANGHSKTQTILFLPRRRDIVRALALLWATALDDIPLMESIAWTRGFAESDAVLEQYVRFVENMPQWRDQ